MTTIPIPRGFRALAVGAALLLAPIAARATDSSRAQVAPASQPSPVVEEWSAEAPLVGANWIEHFDLYATGSEMIGQGGWEGWGGVATVGALTSDTQARSALNSVAIVDDTDLVHQYSGFTTGVWTYTAWQYLPTAVTTPTYFILVNTYPATVTDHWSTQLCFDGAAGVLRDDPLGTCLSATTLPLIRDQWVEIRVVIDLDTDTQTVFYGGVLLYTAPWSTHLGPGGVVNIAAVDLFANLATETFYDDISLSNLPFLDGFESGDSRNWHQTTTGL